MGYNQLQKLTDNIKALRIALNWKSGDELTDIEITSLKRYSGFGGIKSILYPKTSIQEWKKLGASIDDIKMFHPIMGLHELLENELHHEEYQYVLNSTKESVLTAFYTPQIIPETIFSVLKNIKIQPKKLYEPSAGAGIFITEAIRAYPELQTITAVEKDILTGRVLDALASTLPITTIVQITGLEETSNSENLQHDLIISNIPFGNFAVYDKNYSDKAISGKIHNYFVIKGLDKLSDGGLMVYVTTAAFLNSSSNDSVREMLFKKADFISLTIMPDNLMKDSGGTEASSHLLIVQKNVNKSVLSTNELLLLKTEKHENEFGDYSLNSYISAFESKIAIGNVIKEGRNQYGKATREYWQNGSLDDVALKLSNQLEVDIQNVNIESFQSIQSIQFGQNHSAQIGKLTMLKLPVSKNQATTEQLGLFDIVPVKGLNRALDYLTDLDEIYILKSSVRIISVIRTLENPDHEGLVLLCGKVKGSEKYQYKLYSNFEEIKVFQKWMTGKELNKNLAPITDQLRQFDHEFNYEGDKSLEGLYNLRKEPGNVVRDIKHYHINGTLIISANKTGVLTNINKETNTGTFEPLNNQKNHDFYIVYSKMREHYLELLDNDQGEEAVNSGIRKELNLVYDQIIATYGRLNEAHNKKRIVFDTAFGLIILASLEIKNGEQFTKSDIMSGPIQVEIGNFVTNDPMVALSRSLNDRGLVDLHYMQEMTDFTSEELIYKLKGHIYLNPENDTWETASEYLSGNVVEKLANANLKFKLQPEVLQYKLSYEAILKIQPLKIPFELLDFNFGERWMPIDYYTRFASDFFELTIEVHYFSSTDVFKVVQFGTNTKISTEYAVTQKSGTTTNGNTMLEYALENTAPHFTYEVPFGTSIRRVPDNEATQLAHQKIEKIRSGFIDWLNLRPENEKKEIEELYNNTFNCYVLRKYDGSHLNFQELNKENLGIPDLYSSQKDAAWRIIQNRGGLIDHEVGLGKTLTMIIAAYEMKRLGIVHKPIILALKANVQEIADTFRLAYPKAKVLSPGKEDFTPDQRTRIFHEIKNNHWDCIILTHDQFGKIPQSNKIQQKIIQIELNNTKQDLDTVNLLGGDLSIKMLKGLQVRVKNLNAKLLTVTNAIEQKKDTGITFDALGVDHIFIDESHKFKNLTFTTRHNRVAGLGNQEGSQKALNMLFAIRTLQDRYNKDLCVTFLSGTPISNSLTELYLIFKYLRPKEMLRQGISNFDGWAAVYAKKTTDFEFSVTNEIISKERFREFIKVPELGVFYNEITDYKTAKQISLDKPEIDEILVNIPPTPDQVEFTKKLMEFAKTGNGSHIGRPPLSPSEDKGRMLIATNYAKKMATDMRLIDEHLYDDHPNNKINTCAKYIADFYWDSNAFKGTQAVFCDIGTPKPDRFNVYDALRDKLVNDFKIPRGEIAFIHDWRDTKKPEFIKRMNNGVFRVSIGSTEMLGTGNNIQDRMVAMHELDIPWRPSDLEQRTGRGARKGNWVAKLHYGNKIKHLIYATEQSLDNYKFNLLKSKQTFIIQLKNSELNVRRIDEGSLDEKTGMNFSEYIAILSGDTSLLQKSKLEKKIAVLESLKVAHYRENYQSKHQLKFMEEELVKTLNTLQDLKEDQRVYQNNLIPDKNGSKLNPIHIHGLNSDDPEVIGTFLFDMYRTWGKEAGVTKKREKIGSLYGFDLYIKSSLADYDRHGNASYGYHNTYYAQRLNSIQYFYNGGLPSFSNAKLASRYFLAAIDRGSNMLEKCEIKYLNLEKEIPQLKLLTIKPFEKENELLQFKQELDLLEKEIAKKIQDKQEPQVETQVDDVGFAVGQVNEDISPRRSMRI